MPWDIIEPRHILSGFEATYITARFFLPDPELAHEVIKFKGFP